MAISPVAAASPMEDEGEEAPVVDEAAPADDSAPVEEEAEHEVILTVCREPDGTYRLIQGDEDDADAGGEAEADATGIEDGEQGKVYDSIGALLKAVLDVLNEGEESKGADGSSEDQFQAGFGGADGSEAPAAGAGAEGTPLAQKY